MNGRMKKNGYNFRAPFRSADDGKYTLDASGYVIAQFANGERVWVLADGGRFVGTAAEVVADALNAYCARRTPTKGEGRRGMSDAATDNHGFGAGFVVFRPRDRRTDCDRCAWLRVVDWPGSAQNGQRFCAKDIMNPTVNRKPPLVCPYYKERIDAADRAERKAQGGEQ